MEAKAAKVEAVQASGGERWTHDRVIGEYQQYFVKRLLTLDQYLLKELVDNKVITRKASAQIARLLENYPEEGLDSFIAVIKRKNASKFITFLEILETTFGLNKDHKSLVSQMSEHLLLIPDLDEAERGIVERVVCNAQDIGSEVSVGQTDIHQGGMVAVGQTVIESESKVTQTAQPTAESVPKPKQSEMLRSQLDSGGAHRPLPPTEHTPGSMKGSIIETTKVQTGGGAVESLKEVEESVSAKMTRMNVADTPTVRPPRGFIEPRRVQFFSSNNLVNDVWSFQSVEHGVLISIPKEAKPSDIDVFSVTLHAYLWGNFDIPEEYEICTAILVLQLQPRFNFCKPVTLKIPHSVLVDEDDEPEDFVVLCVPEPGHYVQSEIHTSTPSSVHQPTITDTQTTVPSDHQAASDASESVQPDYKFSGVISDADYSEDYYVQVNLDHFSAFVGAKRRRRFRQRKGSLPLNRQSSVNKQRRERKRVMKERIKKLEKGGSIGSSRQSSHDDSFDNQSPASLRQWSSAECDRPFKRQLQRQGAIDIRQQQESSTDEDGFNNEIIVYCCGHEQSMANWTTRFMIAPNTPTGVQALRNAANIFVDKWCYTEMEPLESVVTPSEASRYIGFEPAEWSDNDWMIQATAMPQIHLSQVCRSGGPEGQPPHVDFDVKSMHRCCTAPLNVKIMVTGATVNDREPFFIIKSTKRHVKNQGAVVYTPPWLYRDDSQILRALMNASEDIVLDPSQPDHCKLLADIAFQIPVRIYDDLLGQFGFTEAFCDQLEAAETRNLPECVYRALKAYVGDPQKRQSLSDLKTVLAKVGISDIQLCHTSVQILSDNPQLCRGTCDHDLCLGLAENSPGSQWRFVGRYLGLGTTDIDGKLTLLDRCGEKEAVIQMLHDWKQQFDNGANMEAMVKAVYRVGQLQRDKLWWWLRNEIQQRNLLF